MRHTRVPADEQVSAVRRFNRFYTRQIGLLEEGLLKSEFSLTEARILFELAHRDRLTATDLGSELALDAGYLSRILRKFEERGLLERRPSPSDARQALLTLTDKGRHAFEPLDEASRQQVAGLLAALPAGERDRLVSAMNTVERLLGTVPEPRVPYLLRPLRVGDLGWITHRQGLLYHQEYGWDETYEALVAQILSEFVRKFDPRHEAAWIAERDGEIVGSVFVVRQSDEIAKLRLLYVEPVARGLGIGQRLVGESITFARGKGYRTLMLWTNDILASARRIYQAAGFRLVAEERHHSFGKDLVGQTWELDL
ncbi:bifunctional helix-turn-helix transcriptional regulator/GNAT family N-acetyltransferase [Chelativorans sp. AA-79]|uniref:bifunctional helix-turn-helix transcriptional regulator/GNAT family N-acetyltransferase n=1 Tax=Chelativorans sp. AA-79 TaxID=3028735 RepID=UPI0023F85DE7|nr:bifunctional helix-turn-helix transcriptional regulator/GNAT family N-acetyltransferase [Chelativorans sp. AA-79]WEX11196.1 bifunctional helix-turn-helix transcriptional regulator/GNAT family N-acetyltransferase [Chelativorans sp. AA-79]